MVGRRGVFFLLASLAFGQADKKPGTAKPRVVAVIVHAKNPVKKISFSELRAYLKMEYKFWPNKKRCDVYLPPRKTPEYDVLLKSIYRMSHKKLQKYWVRKLFSGQIPAKPSYVPTHAAAISRVRRSEGAIAVVPATTMPKGVRILLIDGKKPGEKGYPLVAKPSP